MDAAKVGFVGLGMMGGLGVATLPFLSGLAACGGDDDEPAAVAPAGRRPCGRSFRRNSVGSNSNRTEPSNFFRSSDRVRRTTSRKA